MLGQHRRKQNGADREAQTGGSSWHRYLKVIRRLIVRPTGHTAISYYTPSKHSPNFADRCIPSNRDSKDSRLVGCRQRNYSSKRRSALSVLLVAAGEQEDFHQIFSHKLHESRHVRIRRKSSCSPAATTR